MNDYQNALYKVCSIIEDYDQYKLIPIYGFGGCPNFPPPLMNTQTKVSHCFPATGNWNNSIGRGLINTYQIYDWVIPFFKLRVTNYYTIPIREKKKTFPLEGSNFFKSKTFTYFDIKTFTYE